MLFCPHDWRAPSLQGSCVRAACTAESCRTAGTAGSAEKGQTAAAGHRNSEPGPVTFGPQTNTPTRFPGWFCLMSVKIFSHFGRPKTVATCDT